MYSLACVASVSVRFRSKERGTRVKDRAKNGVSKRAGRGCSETKRKRLLRRLCIHEQALFSIEKMCYCITHRKIPNSSSVDNTKLIRLQCRVKKAKFYSSMFFVVQLYVWFKFCLLCGYSNM